MLMQHFKLDVQPFGVTPDARFLYLSSTHREALASLFYGIQAGRGFTGLIASPGMGKTTLLFHLLGLLMGNAKTAFLFQTLCGPEEFLRSLLADLGIDDEGGDPVRMHAKLNAYLLQESKNGRQVVVVIDEAQNLDERVLELVRMLSNFETPGKKLMHLVLSGQPQLAERLSSEQFTQLRQRISIIARLAPFTAEETREYVEHRLRVAGAPADRPIFSKEAYTAIAEQSGGIPRNINNLCFNAMSLACALNKSQVDALMVRETVSDLDLTTIPQPKAPSAGEPLAGTLSILHPVTSDGDASRYRWAAAIAFLICLVILMLYLAAPPNTQVLAQPAAVDRTGSDLNAQPAIEALSQVRGQQQNSGKETTSKTIAPAQVPRRKGHSHLNRRSSEQVSGSETIVQPASEPSSGEQGIEKSRSTADKTPVPLESVPQREKP